MSPDEGGQTEEAFWWKALVSRLFSPLQVQIIEALRVSERPLTPVDLARILDEEVHCSVLARHLRSLAAHDVVALAERPASSAAVEAPYHLTWKQLGPSAGNGAR